MQSLKNPSLTGDIATSNKLSLLETNPFSGFCGSFKTSQKRGKTNATTAIFSKLF